MCHLLTKREIDVQLKSERWTASHHPLQRNFTRIGWVKPLPALCAFQGLWLCLPCKRLTVTQSLKGQQAAFLPPPWSSALCKPWEKWWIGLRPLKISGNAYVFIPQQCLAQNLVLVLNFFLEQDITLQPWTHKIEAGWAQSISHLKASDKPLCPAPPGESSKKTIL